ncbi:hypothetical protein K491DRAFT_136246 [Lophiostoma macrostomum CBS 122681]|uniref:BTB domain-containing protein n=1 Tax=Lophiostoma macrostomum CBS 122681 TaxID=1314788 RepID=A0A6A6TMK3_9PLEO|nr:hypothetical protein K491DRAFT_136246 [Lophiostoma macrostomum CBS 122681]
MDDCLSHNRLDMGTKVIAVRVGSNKALKDFTVHEALVRKSSPFFEKALAQDWVESQSRIVKLPTMKPPAFQLYVQWLYSSRLYLRIDEKSKLVDRSKVIECCINAYLLGDYLQDIAFKDTLIDLILEWSSMMYVLQAAVLLTKDVYANTPEDSLLRQLLVDLSVWGISPYAWKISADSAFEFPNAFLMGVVTGQSKRLSDIDPSGVKETGYSHFKKIKGTCIYHCHRDGPCYKSDVQVDGKHSTTPAKK